MQPAYYSLSVGHYVKLPWLSTVTDTLIKPDESHTQTVAEGGNARRMKYELIAVTQSKYHLLLLLVVVVVLVVDKNIAAQLSYGS